MKKRIVSVILCLAMLLTVLPAAVSAAGNIRSVSVSIAMNVADGEPIPFDSNLLEEGQPDFYTAYFWSYSWSCSDGVMLPDPNYMPNFQGGERYKMMLLIVPKDGTAGLNNDTAASLPVFINGQKATYNPECKPELSEAPGKDVYAYEIEVQCPWTDVISVIDLYGAVLPTPGAMPTASGLSVPAGAPYEIHSVTWEYYTGKPGESSSYRMPEDTAFQNGVYYYLAVELAAKDGYSFASTDDCIFRINGTSDMVDTIFSRTSGSDCTVFTNDYQAQPRHVDEIRIDNLNPFYVGQTPGAALKDITIPAGAGYSIFSSPDCNVSYVSTNTYINDDSLFEADTAYRATFRIRPAEGWTIDSSTVWRINGSTDLVYYASESTDYWYVKTVGISAAATTPIEEVYIYGYETPKVGEMAGDYLNMFTVGGLYDIVEAYWYCDTSRCSLLENETFEEGRLYSACVVLEPCDPAFTFDGPVEFYLNSGEFPMDFGDVEDGSAFVWTAQMYPKTGEGHTVSWYLDPADTIPVTGVEVADGEVFGAPAEPGREGYTFGGWFTDRACTVPYDPTAPIYADTDLFPKWLPAAEIITEVCIGGFEAPRAGETRIGAEDLFVPDDAHYTINSLEWYYSPTPYTAESFTGPFVEGNAYFASISVTPDEGYAFAEDTVVKINGLIVTDWFPFLDPSGDFCIDSPDIIAESTPVFIPITAVNAQIPEPVAGQKPAAASDIVVTSTPSDADVMIGDLTWFCWDETIEDENKWTVIEDSDYVFEADKIYAIDLYLYTQDDYGFAKSVDGTVNGEPSDTTYGAVYTNLNEVYLSYSWAAGELPADPCEGYTDIDRGSWYHDAVDFVIDRGYMGSTKTDALTFEPNTKVSRAMVASILYRMAGSPAVEYKKTFTDVPADKWFTDAIEWCAQNGLASGKGNGKFDPNGNVTRQELAVFMMKTAEYFGETTTGRADLGTFVDAAKVPAWAKTYLEWAVDAGLISGKANGGKTYLAPTDNATRAELASIIMRFCDKFGS